MRASLHRAARSASLGCLLGACAALLMALADYGAHFLWLNDWRDRGVLLLRLVGTQVPAGACAALFLGLLLGASDGLREALAARLRLGRAHLREVADSVARALQLTALLAPWPLLVGALLFTGGKTSRLPLRGLWEALASALLLASLWLAAYLACRLLAMANQRPRALRWLAAFAFGAGFCSSKVNQWVLPKLYEYLHASLTVATFLCFCSALWLLLRSLRPRVLEAPAVHFAAAPVFALAVAGLAGTLARLDANQNVHVALLHPNAASSRTVMQALAPILIEPAQRRALAEARERARRHRAIRTRRVRSTGGPVVEDAHVLLVTIDALRPDHLGLHGYERATSPQLDRLAADSVVFERAYAQAPHSSYSLCSLMASEYLHETRNLGAPEPKDTLATVLGAAGYHTAAFYSSGIFHTEAEKLQGFEREAFGFALHDQVTYEAEALTNRVLAEVDRVRARGEPNALFWVHYFDVHEPYRSTRFGTSDRDRYDGEILEVDRAFARLLRELKRRLTRQVIVVVSADHGEEFLEHGGVYHGSTLYDEQVRVPLIVNAPGLPPRRVRQPVESIDIVPTVLGLLGMDVPAAMRGDDLRQLALGAGEDPGPVFSAVIHKKMVVRWPHKLIADLRFGLYELYDLARDPGERDNLANREPVLLASLRDEVYAWLDGLTPAARTTRDPTAAALEWGRLGDRRAVLPLSDLVADSSARAERRIEAARMLGHLADERAAPRLLQAIRAEPPLVAAEAAVALGRMYDQRAREALRPLVTAEDPDLRVRAAVSLGRLRDPYAVPALIDALWIAESDYERMEAVRWLGRLRDRRALEPLIHALPELRTRYLVVVALGLIGDARAYDALAQVLRLDPHANVRDATLQGLALLGDPRALELILPLAAEDASLSLAAESLVRLGGLERGSMGGIDGVAQSLGTRQFSGCHVESPRHDWDYLHRTYCVSAQSASSVSLAVPPALARAPDGAIAVLAIRRTDSNQPTELQVRIGEHLAQLTVHGAWRELRWLLPPERITGPRMRATLTAADPEARFALDHLLLLPRNPEVVARAPGTP